mgnify:CR=1
MGAKFTELTKPTKDKWSGLHFVFFRKAGRLFGNISINGNYVPGITASGPSKKVVRESLLSQFIAMSAEHKKQEEEQKRLLSGALPEEGGSLPGH